jgi:hypothetical protein
MSGIPVEGGGPNGYNGIVKKPFLSASYGRDAGDAAGGPEPRWPAITAGLATGGVFLFLPEKLSVGPSWLPLAVIAVLQVPLVFAHRRGHHRTNQVLGYTLLGILTAFLVGSLALLVHSLPHLNQDTVTAKHLLQSAAALWAANILVFSSWYWRLDGGGPHARDLRAFHCDGAFLFPQMSLDKDQRAEMGETNWSPQYIDYLFLAFNTSSALSPADTGALSRWAKALMMVQATISLSVLALIAARGVNII